MLTPQTVALDSFVRLGCIHLKYYYHHYYYLVKCIFRDCQQLLTNQAAKCFGGRTTTCYLAEISSASIGVIPRSYGVI